MGFVYILFPRGNDGVRPKIIMVHVFNLVLVPWFLFFIPNIYIALDKTEMPVINNLLNDQFCETHNFLSFIMCVCCTFSK